MNEKAWKTWWRIAGVLAATAVIAGAFGAHALKDRLDADKLHAFNVAARYQMYHALGLFAVGWMVSVRPSRRIRAAGVCMVLGVVLFSGSLYALALVDWRWLGPVTPLGGALLILAWSLLVAATFHTGRVRNESSPNESRSDPRDH